MPGKHFPSSNAGIGHAICVHLASLLLPLAGQVHVLHPSGAVHDKWGQQLSSGNCGSSGSSGSCLNGGIKHLKLVHMELLFEPLHGHMHVFRPSPAG